MIYVFQQKLASEEKASQLGTEKLKKLKEELATERSKLNSKDLIIALEQAKVRQLTKDLEQIKLKYEEDVAKKVIKETSQSADTKKELAPVVSLELFWEEATKFRSELLVLIDERIQKERRLTDDSIDALVQLQSQKLEIDF